MKNLNLRSKLTLKFTGGWDFFKMIFFIIIMISNFFSLFSILNLTQSHIRKHLIKIDLLIAKIKVNYISKFREIDLVFGINFNLIISRGLEQIDRQTVILQGFRLFHLKYEALKIFKFLSSYSIFRKINCLAFLIKFYFNVSHTVRKIVTE